MALSLIRLLAGALQFSVQTLERPDSVVERHVHVMPEPYPEAVLIADSTVRIAEIDMSMMTIQAIGGTSNETFLLVLHNGLPSHLTTPVLFLSTEFLNLIASSSVLKDLSTGPYPSRFMQTR